VLAYDRQSEIIECLGGLMLNDDTYEKSEKSEKQTGKRSGRH
jgi:hypothetical protein